MSTTLTILQVGVVGSVPRLLFMNTTATETEVIAPGFINQVEQVSDVKVQPGDYIFALMSLNQQELFVPTFVDGEITLAPIAGDGPDGPITGLENIGTGDGVFAQLAGTVAQLKSLIAGTNITLTPTGDSITINASGAISISDAANIGPGDGVFAQVVANVAEFKSLVAGTNVTLTPNADSITIDATGTLSVTDLQNIGSGAGVFAQLSGTVAQLKSLVAGANVIITPSADSITIAATGSGGGTITDGVNLGTGVGVFESVSGTDMQFQSLVAGPNVSVTGSGTQITIGAPEAVIGASNLGAGAPVFAGEVSNSLQFKTLLGGDNIDLATTDSTITISATGGGGGNFNYLNTYWVAQNGNDANNGLSINSPLLTMAAVQARMITGSSYVIRIEDQGFYPVGGFGNLPGTRIAIIAPGATFTYNGNPNGMFVISTNGADFYLQCSRIDGTGLTTQPAINGLGYLATVDINIQEVVNCANIYVDTFSTPSSLSLNIGSTDVAGGVITIGNASPNITSAEINIVNCGQCVFKNNNTTYPVKINSNYFNGSFDPTGVGTFILNLGNVGSSFSAPTLAQLANNAVNIPSDATYGPFYPIPYVQYISGNTFATGQINGQPYNVIPNTAGSFNVSITGSNYMDFSNAFFAFNNPSLSSVFTLTDDNTIPMGFRFKIFQQGGAQIGFTLSYPGGNIISERNSNTVYTNTTGSYIELIKLTNASPNQYAAIGHFA